MNRFDNEIKKKRNDILIINNISAAMVTNEISIICIRYGVLCTLKMPRCRTCYIIMFNAIRKLNCNNKTIYIYKRKITFVVIFLLYPDILYFCNIQNSVEFKEVTYENKLWLLSASIFIFKYMFKKSETCQLIISKNKR